MTDGDPIPGQSGTEPSEDDENAAPEPTGDGKDPENPQGHDAQGQALTGEGGGEDEPGGQ